MGAILSHWRQEAQVTRNINDGEPVHREMGRTTSNYFQSNGALLLQKQVLYSNDKANPIRMYSEKELKKATRNYTRVIGGFGSCMFEGLIDGRVIVVKQRGVWSDLEQCITEIVLVSNISHRHVNKLLGCCLETELPLLVYEYVSNGNLSKHIIREDGGKRQLLSWMDRLRIANEVADALNYLHSYFSTAIIHRDIRASNILLDEHCNAKIVGFDLVLPMPDNKVLVTHNVEGVWGYADPEYVETGELNEKSDIYSFGVLLIQLLTGKHNQIIVNLVESFVSCEQDDQMAAILDAIVIEEGSTEQIRAFTVVAMKCINNERVKRPSMKEVTQEIRQIRRM